MPPKPPPDENLTFLWACLKNSDYKKIDMPAVAKTFNIKPGAAGTRFYRLKQRMEPDAASPTKGAKRNAEESGMDGEEQQEEVSPKKKKASVKDKGVGKKAGGAKEKKVKEEVASDDEVGNGEEGGEDDGGVCG